MMDDRIKQLIAANIEFLKRCNLRGDEVPAFNEVMVHLHKQLEEQSNELPTTS